MYVAQLRLRDFRNYERLTLTFPPGLHLFIGPNGAGKTNLLEAVHVLAVGRSHRTARDADLIRHGQDGFSAAADVVRLPEGSRTSLELQLSGGQKRFTVNGLAQPRVSDLVGKMAVVLFSPDDLGLVKGPPALRRRMLDLALAQAHPVYYHSLRRYQRALLQRNALLRASLHRPATDVLEPLTEELAATGAEIIVRRWEWVGRLAQVAQLAYAQLSGDREELRLVYESSPDLRSIPAVPRSPSRSDMIVREIAHRLIQALNRARAEEAARRQTVVGPHRDDVQIWLSGRPAREQASQGQQRSVALALKAAELELMRESLGQSPILLLDDVASELDEPRRRALPKLVAGAVQTLVTGTRASDFAFDLGGAALWQVAEGRVQPA